MMMIRSSVHTQTHWLLVILVALLAGCSGQDGPRLNENDIGAINELYASNTRLFRQTRIAIDVTGRDTIDVEIEGMSSPKENASNKEAEASGKSLWVPVVLLRELPTYYRGTDYATNTPMRTEAYKAKEGLWCIVAAVQMTSRKPPADLEPDEAETPVHLRLTLLSREFQSGLPLLVPVSPERSNVDASITLPDNSRFTSLEFGGSDRIATQPALLTVLPSHLSGGKTTAAAALVPGESRAWDFSRVGFQKTAGWRVWELGAGLSLAVVVGFFVRRSRLVSRWQSAWHEASEIRRFAEREFTNSPIFGSALALEESFAKNERARGLSQVRREREHIVFILRKNVETERNKVNTTDIGTERWDEESKKKRIEQLHQMERRLEHFERYPDIAQAAFSRTSCVPALCCWPWR